MLDRSADDPVARDAEIEAVARAHGTDAQELLREVSAFRVALDADLTIAAAALDADAEAVARDVLDADRESLAGFEKRLLARVDRDRHTTRRSRVTVSRRHRLTGPRRTAVAATAAALVGLAGGAAFAATATDHDAASATPPVAHVPTVQLTASASPSEVIADRQAITLQYAISQHASTATIAAAAAALHTTLIGLVSRAPSDPALAHQLWQLLQQERTSLVGLGSSDPAIAAALSQTEQLLRQLGTQLSPSVLATASASLPLPLLTSAGVSAQNTAPPTAPTTASTTATARTTGPASSTGPTTSTTPSAPASTPELLPFPTPSSTSGTKSGSGGFPLSP
jgi:hypothetical protein